LITINTKPSASSRAADASASRLPAGWRGVSRLWVSSGLFGIGTQSTVGLPPSLIRFIIAGLWLQHCDMSGPAVVSSGRVSPVFAGAFSNPGLLLGLLITLAAVVAYSAYITWQVAGLRKLQSELIDRNRKDSLQLLRIQNDLNLLAVAMRDMIDNDEPYPLTAWSAQFQRIRTDLDDAMRLEAGWHRPVVRPSKCAL
jgi:hypothetical protein